MIEKPLLSLKRLLLLPVFFVLTLAVGFSELVYLSKTNKSNVVLGFSNENVMIESAGEDAKNVSVDAIVSGADARPMLIKKYLEKYNSPMAPYSDLIFQISEDYGFEYYWIVAIAQQESNLCKKAPENSYNCWGYGIHKKGTLRFDGYELAIKSYAEYLKREYFDKGLNTPELMMKKYCPSSNGSWANGVNQFIEELKSGSF
ncbi:MAG: hypothetical protein PHN66_04055 [Candidatus Shapirobacteria bacterium]|nr:hypothetical protein [Candidatus Shapirobacteria bacterium]